MFTKRTLMDSIKMSRQELYNLVWSKPLTTLAKEFSYSDSGLRKICIKHNIPLPKAGHWSKIKFNKKVKKVALPTTEESNALITIYPGKGEKMLSMHPNAGHKQLIREWLFRSNGATCFGQTVPL